MGPIIKKQIILSINGEYEKEHFASGNNFSPTGGSTTGGNVSAAVKVDSL